MKLRHPVTGFVRDVADEGRARTLQHRGYEPVDDDTPIGLPTTAQPGKAREGIPAVERAAGEQSMQVPDVETGTATVPPPGDQPPGGSESDEDRQAREQREKREAEQARLRAAAEDLLKGLSDEQIVGLSGRDLDGAVDAVGIDASTGGTRQDGGLNADEKRAALIKRRDELLNG